MNKRRKEKINKTNIKPEISEDYLKSEILDRYFNPNVQFIRSVKQLSPHATNLVSIFEKFRDTLQISKIHSISSRTGSGFMINSANFNIENFNRDKILEIIDFDPVRNNLMVIGNEPPVNEVIIHWFIYRGLPWINGIISINNNELIEKFQDSAYPIVDINGKMINTNKSLEILKYAKTSNIVILGNQSILIVGKTLEEVYESLKGTLKKLSKTKATRKSKKSKSTRISKILKKLKILQGPKQ